MIAYVACECMCACVRVCMCACVSVSVSAADVFGDNCTEVVLCGQESKPARKRRMEDEEWFHGVLPREEVQRLLTEDGSYLVRESKNRKTNETQYVLSVYWQGHKHFIIQGAEVGWKLAVFLSL